MIISTVSNEPNIFGCFESKGSLKRSAHFLGPAAPVGRCLKRPALLPFPTAHVWCGPCLSRYFGFPIKQANRRNHLETLPRIELQETECLKVNRFGGFSELLALGESLASYSEIVVEKEPIFQRVDLGMPLGWTISSQDWGQILTTRDRRF